VIGKLGLPEIYLIHDHPTQKLKVMNVDHDRAVIITYDTVSFKNTNVVLEQYDFLDV
jgi:hypothetical protein